MEKHQIYKLVFLQDTICLLKEIVNNYQIKEGEEWKEWRLDILKKELSKCEKPKITERELQDMLNEAEKQCREAGRKPPEGFRDYEERIYRYVYDIEEES